MNTSGNRGVKNNGVGGKDVKDKNNQTRQGGVVTCFDKYISYGIDSNYFAVVGIDLYHRERESSSNYRLLKHAWDTTTQPNH